MAPVVERLRAFFFPARGILLAAPYAVVAFLGVALGTLAGVSTPGERIDWTIYDLFSRRIASGNEPAPDVMVVAIDEPSFAEIGLAWPWPRSLHGTLIERLVEGGARTIALDIIFDVPAKDPDEDHALAEAIRAAGNVVLAVDQAAIEDRGYDLTQWAEPIPPLAEAAAGLGVIRIPYDEDGVLRRAWLSIDGRPSLAWAVASHQPGFTASPPGGEEGAGHAAPRLFRYNGPPRRGIVTVSYYQALDAAASLPPSIFKGKHVLVGRSLAATTIDEQADHFTTPLSPRMPGVEVHATIVDALLRDGFIADPLRNWAALLLFCVVAGVLVAAVSYRLGPVAASLVTVITLAFVFGAGYVALTRGVRLPVMAPGFAVAGGYGLTAAYRFALVTRERRMIKRAFQHYVAPAIVEQMLDDPSRLRLGGTEYEVTVLFSDLEGFTTLSEYLGPEELSAQLGRYFKEMLDELLAERGTLDKLIGDSIMMYFGCPIPDDRHAMQACRGALAMQKRMRELNARWRGQGLPELRTRIGINTGRAVAGNTGTDTIFNYTILGDCVNLASRLEGVNKEYETLIILGEDTWQRVHDAFETRELDWIRVKGKQQAVAIYELAAEAGGLAPVTREVFRLYGEGLSLYRSGRWQAAAASFTAALAVDANDGPSRTMVNRCAEYLQSAPAGWDGVYVRQTK